MECQQGSRGHVVRRGETDVGRRHGKGREGKAEH